LNASLTFAFLPQWPHYSSGLSRGLFWREIMFAGYYEIFGLNRSTVQYDQWLGTGTPAAAEAVAARLGCFVGYGEVTADGWACRAKKAG
jgi:hypothetical protein